MKHSIRFQLTLTYVIGVIMAVLLAYATFHIIVEPWSVRLTLPFVSGSPPNDFDFLFRLLISAIVVSVLLGALMAHNMTHRIAGLAAAAKSIAAGNLVTRVPTNPLGDELDLLGTTFNEMSDRLSESLAQQKKLEQARRELVANVAHDLRTPLAAVQAAVEALDEGVATDETTSARYRTAIGQQTRHLGRLIDDLFALSQLQAGQFELRLEAVYLENVLQDCLAGLMPQAERAGITMSVDLPAMLPPVRADRHAMRRVLNNLIHNAIEFTPAHGTITLTGTSIDHSVEIQVCDTGPGISPEDMEPGADGLPRVFDRFYRGDKARSRGGGGLGLTIVKELVQAQGGQISIKSKPGEGTSIGFTLPVYQPN
ncbi:MAG: HAMP domain-containing histidine kinase [Chloroflexi bacterium]|nr:HAMP domain-containing histidine kinase [Chloroflexota bacterium]